MEKSHQHLLDIEYGFPAQIGPIENFQDLVLKASSMKNIKVKNPVRLCLFLMFDHENQTNSTKKSMHTSIRTSPFHLFFIISKVINVRHTSIV